MTSNGNHPRRFRLLPNLTLLAALEGVLLVLLRHAELLVVVMFFQIGYVAVVALKTKEAAMMREEHVGVVEKVLFRWSGAIVFTIALFLIVLVAFCMGTPFEESWIASRPGLFIVKWLVELGLILAVACLYVSPRTRHVPPVSFWRITVVPLLLIFGAYVVLIPIGQLAGDDGTNDAVIHRITETPSLG